MRLTSCQCARGDKGMAQQIVGLVVPWMASRAKAIRQSVVSIDCDSPATDTDMRADEHRDASQRRNWPSSIRRWRMARHWASRRTQMNTRQWDGHAQRGRSSPAADVVPSSLSLWGQCWWCRTRCLPHPSRESDGFHCPGRHGDGLVGGWTLALQCMRLKPIRQKVPAKQHCELQVHPIWQAATLGSIFRPRTQSSMSRITTLVLWRQTMAALDYWCKGPSSAGT